MPGLGASGEWPVQRDIDQWHFLEQRGSRHAEPEIRKLANVLLDLLVAESPNLFGDSIKTPLPDGTFELTTPFPKV